VTPAQPGPARGDRLAFAAAALACISLYLAVASVNRVAYATQPVTWNNYNLLADGFRKGHLYMDLSFTPPAPGQALPAYTPALHDVSVYKGRAYLYFGPTPALVVFLPWRILTGSHLPQYWGAAILVCVGYLASLALLCRVKRDHFPSLSPWLVLAGGVLLGLINWWPILLSRIGMWELPIAGAFCFSMLAVLFVYLGASGGGRKSCLALASLFYGLAVASRPNYLFGSLVLFLPLLYLWRAERSSPVARSEWIRRLCAAVLPIAGVGVLLALYNYLRFGNPMEFGTSYMVLLTPEPTRLFSTSYAWTNTVLYFLTPAHLSPWFPFFKVPRLPVVPEGYTSDPEEMFGVLANMPVLLFALAGVWLAGFRDRLSRLGLAVASCTLLFAAAWGFLLFYCGTNSRYTVDAMCGLPLLTVLGIWALEERAGAGARRILARIAWGALAAYSVFFVVCVGVQRDELFRTIHPKAYRVLAHAFDKPSSLYDSYRGVTYGPLDLSVRFPADKPGRSEPLVSTGWRPWANAIYVRYTDAAHVQFGFFGPAGPTLGAPVAVDYGRTHEVRISMGSFYPPRESPFFDEIDGPDADTLANTLYLELDGRTILHQRAYFFDATSKKPVIGEGPPVHGAPWVFTGTISVAGAEPDAP
jgi:hypothetical protein